MTREQGTGNREEVLGNFTFLYTFLYTGWFFHANLLGELQKIIGLTHKSQNKENFRDILPHLRSKVETFYGTSLPGFQVTHIKTLNVHLMSIN
jgi:hypothetical protein